MLLLPQLLDCCSYCCSKVDPFYTRVWCFYTRVWWIQKDSIGSVVLYILLLDRYKVNSYLLSAVCPYCCQYLLACWHTAMLTGQNCVCLWLLVANMACACRNGYGLHYLACMGEDHFTSVVRHDMDVLTPMVSHGMDLVNSKVGPGMDDKAAPCHLLRRAPTGAGG